MPSAYCRLPTAYCRLSAHLWVEEAVGPARQQVASLGQGRVQQREAAALPEGVAAVDELVGPPLEPPLARHLSVREPVGHQIQLEQVSTAQQHLVGSGSGVRVRVGLRAGAGAGAGVTVGVGVTVGAGVTVGVWVWVGLPMAPSPPGRRRCSRHAPPHPGSRRCHPRRSGTSVPTPPYPHPAPRRAGRICLGAGAEAQGEGGVTSPTPSPGPKPPPPLPPPLPLASAHSDATATAVYAPRTSHSPSSCMEKPPSSRFMLRRKRRSAGRSMAAYASSVPRVTSALT